MDQDLPHHRGLPPAGLRDPCYEEHVSVLVIVPGDRVVTARCDPCWCYGHPREFTELSPGGRKNAFPGTCRACTEEDGP